MAEMDEFERFAAALANIESGDRELAWGDPTLPTGGSDIWVMGTEARVSGRNFLAAGRWQMHPAFVWDYRPDPIRVDSSWDEVFRQVLHNFYQRRRALTERIERLAMEFHLGVTAVAHGEWDDGYAARFTRAWVKLGGG